MSTGRTARLRLVLFAILAVAAFLAFRSFMQGLPAYSENMPGVDDLHSRKSVSREEKNEEDAVAAEAEPEEGEKSGSKKTAAGKRTGLSVAEPKLKLDGTPFRIFSGAMHYFRIPHQYWRDRLEKLKACGLNTVETYVAWNLHEPHRGKFDFTNENFDLNLVKFIELAKELGLFVIFRPGPYICAEWDWGALPAWLLQDRNMKVRSTYAGFTSAVESYFAKLIPLIEPLQYTNGGPIIAVQIENEFGSYGADRKYLRWLKDLLVSHGIKELLFTSDGADVLENGTLPNIFATINFKRRIQENFDKLKAFQPGKPLMVGEFWTGWFDHWGEQHHVVTDSVFKERFSELLETGASVNMYMFHGGTNFGFTNGNFHIHRVFRANRNYSELDPNESRYLPTITSYDYDSPLTESGQLSSKWHLTRQFMTKFNNDFDSKRIAVPSSNVPPSADFGELKIEQQLTLVDFLSVIQSKAGVIAQPEFMELICRHGGTLATSGCETQNFGFIAYRKTIEQEGAAVQTGNLKIMGLVNDRAQIIVNGQTLFIVNDTHDDARDMSKALEIAIALPKAMLDAPHLDIVILVENMGRVNYQKVPYLIDDQRKGFSGSVELNGKNLAQWSVFHLDFTPEFWANSPLSAIKHWKAVELKTEGELLSQPAFYRTHFASKSPQDTFAHTKGWSKGVLFVNQFNLGRYWDIGPQETLYVPGVRLKEDSLNEVILFELHRSSDKVTFLNSPKLGSSSTIA